MGKKLPGASRIWCYAIAVVFTNVRKLRVGSHYEYSWGTEVREATGRQRESQLGHRKEGGTLIILAALVVTADRILEWNLVLPRIAQECGPVKHAQNLFSCISVVVLAYPFVRPGFHILLVILVRAPRGVLWQER